MEEIKKFNADIPGRIAEFQAVIKQFELKYKIYRILLRGKGLEFVSFSDYTQEDDASTIDWKASMRANKILIKQYREERNLKVVFLVDVGENMVFGSAEKLKCEYASEVIGTFAHLIITTGDRVGFVLYSDKVKDYIKPKAGLKSFHRFMEAIQNPLIYGGASNLETALDFVIDYIPKGIDSVVYVSDFISFNAGLRRKLSLASRKFETVFVMVKDKLDLTLPDIHGEIVLEDPRSKQQLLVSPNIAKGMYEKFSAEQTDLLRKECVKNNVDILELMTNRGFVPTLAEFLKQRAGAVK